MATPNSPTTPPAPHPLNRIAIAIGVSAFATVTGLVVRRLLRGPVRSTPPTPIEENTEILFGKVPGRNHGDEELLMDPPIVRYDPYFWIRDDDRKREDVLQHLREENKYTNYMTCGSTQRFASRLYRELLTHFMETDVTVPAKDGDWVYYTRTEKGKSYKMFCRKKADQNGQGVGDEHIILDMNLLAKGQPQCDVSTAKISPDGNVLAFSVDFVGYETYEIRFINLTTGEYLQDVIKGTTGNLEWGKEGKQVYYQTFDDAHRPWKVWSHMMNSAATATEQVDDVCLYTENNPEFNLYVSKSSSRRFIFLSSYASTVSEHRFIDLDNKEAGVRLFQERKPDVLYDISHAKDDTFYIVTNSDGATNFKLMMTDVSDTTKWQELMPYNPHRKIDAVSCFKEFAAVSGREAGYREIWIMPDHNPSKMYKLPLEEAAHVVWSGTNLEYDTPAFRFTYSSLTTPTQYFDYNIKEKKSKLLKETEVPEYDRSKYKTERIEAKSTDGTVVPMSLVYNASAVSADGPNRVHLYGYGSYEISIDPAFSMVRLPLLDRGVIYAIAHIRGGGEFGRGWYEAARFETKKKTFEDFCACAEKLVKDKRTTPELMSMEGRSAGGLLMGAVMNMRPDLFKAVIAGVPFVDVLNTMSDPTIPLTTGEWQEWGNPHQRKYYDAISEYCPYTNVGKKPYPAVLILAGLHDPRVMYSEPAKWAAKLRKYSTSGEPILLKVDMSSGHFSASDRYRNLKERSFELAWLLRQVGAPDDHVGH